MDRSVRAGGVTGVNRPWAAERRPKPIEIKGPIPVGLRRSAIRRSCGPIFCKRGEALGDVATH
jgi:hypothetical protein